MSICVGADWVPTDKTVEFLTGFNRKIVEQRVPISGSIDLTDRCNLRCRHCYLDPSDSHSSCSNEMSTSQILDILDEITEAGCLYLLLTGGEPLLRDDFTEIYRHARKNGMIVTVFTNGIRITDELITLFREFPPQAVEISLYGASEETYQAVCGTGTVYNRIRSNARILANAKIPVRLKSVLLSLNLDDLDAMEQFAKELAVPFRFDPAVFPRLDGNTEPLDYRIDPCLAARLELSDPDRFKQWDEYYQKHRIPVNDGLLYHCGAGVTTFHIDAQGGVSPCLMARHYRYELSQNSFRKIWDESIHKLRELPEGDAAGCNRCEVQALCGYCPAFFYLENQCEDHYSAYLCQMGHERHKFLSDRCAVRGEQQ